jgi:hypothetical protein
MHHHPIRRDGARLGEATGKPDQERKDHTIDSHGSRTFRCFVASFACVRDAVNVVIRKGLNPNEVEEFADVDGTPRHGRLSAWPLAASVPCKWSLRRASSTSATDVRTRLA